MPGGHLSYWVYSKLGGERPFGLFWMQLGLPTLALIGAAYFLLCDRSGLHFTKQHWATGSVALIVIMAAAVWARIIM